MSMPGFTAECSLPDDGGRYRAPGRTVGLSNSAIVPQAFLGAARTAQQDTPPVIVIEPEQCVTRCYYFRGIRLFCYEMCF
jgi:hypothetical protein